MKLLWAKISELFKERIRRKKLFKLILSLSVIVVFCTTYLLILPAITLETSTNQTIVQKEDTDAAIAVSDQSESFDVDTTISSSVVENTDTVINQNESSHVASSQFTTESVSYTLAGVNYENFANYLTDGTYEGNATYTASTKTLTANLNLKYSIPKTALEANKNYVLELPTDTSWSSAIQPGVEYTGKDGSRDAFKFRFVEQDGKKYIAITFIDSYVNNSGSQVTGDLFYSADIGETHKQTNGEYKIPFSDDVTITIPPEKIQPKEEQEQEDYDLHSSKSGKVTYDGDQSYLDYTITVWSDKGTKDAVKIADSLTADGLTIESLANITVEQKDYSGWYGETGTNIHTVTNYTLNKTSDNKSFNLELPKLSAKQAYTITYRYKVSNFAAGQDFNVNNKVVTETPDVPVSNAEWWLTLHRNKIGKTGVYNEANNKITWTIVVNENQNDIAGAELKDDMLAKASDIQISPAEGVEKTSTGYKFVATKDGRNTNKYVITYTTDVGNDKPSSWDAAANSVNNKVTITDNGEDSSSTATVPTGKGNTGGLTKSFEKMEATSDPDIKELTWKSTIRMPGDKKLPKDTEFEDTLMGANNTNNGEHYFTKTQLEELYQKLEKVFGVGKFEFSALESGEWNNYTGYGQLSSEKHYWKFKIKLLFEYTGKDVELEYRSIINKSSTTTFTNTISSGSHSSTVSYKYEETGKVFKMDGDDVVWDGIGGEYNTKDTQHTISKDGTINWIVKVALDDTATTATIVDTPASGLKLTNFSYGDKVYGLNATDFTVSDTTITWNNQWYSPYSGLEVSGTIDSNGTIRVTFTTKNGKTLKESLNNTGTLYARFSFKADVNPLDEDIVKSYTNKASASIDGQPIGEDDHTQKITFKPGQKISKGGTWNNDSRQVDYSLTLNPEAQDLAEGKDSYVLTDILSYQEDLTTKLSYDLKQDSVKLFDSNNQEVDKNLWSWTVEKTRDISGQYKSILKVIVPDSQKLTLKYSYSISREVEKDNVANLSVKNAAEIEGLKTGKTETTTSIAWKKIQAGGTAQSNRFFKITKVDTTNFGVVLPGAIFEIRENQTNKVIATYQTAADGTFSITKEGQEAQYGSLPLEENKLYYVVEVVAPQGYELPEESNRQRYYFYFSNSDTLPNNSDNVLDKQSVVNLAKQSKQEYVKNSQLPPTTAITVKKKWLTADGEATDRVNEKISVHLIQVATKTNSVDPNDTPEELTIDKREISKVDNWEITFNDLPTKGTNKQGQEVTYTYKVYEDAVAGYDTTYSNTIKDSGGNDIVNPITSGSITITNKAKQAYVLPHTGGFGVELILLIGAILSSFAVLLLRFEFHKRYKSR